MSIGFLPVFDIGAICPSMAPIDTVDSMKSPTAAQTTGVPKCGHFGDAYFFAPPV
jgi:hypothetical protein